MNEIEEKDRFKKVRSFLYGKDAIRKAENREALVMSTFKGSSKWPYSSQMLESCIGYLKVEHLYDPLYEECRDRFYNYL